MRPWVESGSCRTGFKWLTATIPGGTLFQRPLLSVAKMLAGLKQFTAHSLLITEYRIPNGKQMKQYYCTILLPGTSVLMIDFRKSLRTGGITLRRLSHDSREIQWYDTQDGRLFKRGLRLGETGGTRQVYKKGNHIPKGLRQISKGKQVTE